MEILIIIVVVLLIAGPLWFWTEKQEDPWDHEALRRAVDEGEERKRR